MSSFSGKKKIVMIQKIIKGGVVIQRKSGILEICELQAYSLNSCFATG